MSASTATRRTFLALWPSEELQRELARVTASAMPPRVRVTKASALHVTLVFLGDVVDEIADELDRRIAPLVAARSAPKLVVRGTGAFPSLARPRILWAGVEQLDGTSLAELQDELEACCESLGFAREARAWSPHVTLARSGATRVHEAELARFGALDFRLSWSPDGVSRVVSLPGASEGERYRVAALHPFATGA